MVDKFRKILLGAVWLYLLTVVVQAGIRDSIRNPPPVCCSPDEYEANLQSTGANYKGGVAQQEYDVRFSYDYTNLRWAYHTQDPAGVGNNTRVIYDHKNSMKYLIRNGECFKAKNQGVMERQCVPKNATYHGYFEYGIGEQKLGYDMWSYEYVLYPLRQMLKIARDTCLPIQEGGYGLVANTWAWHVPEPSCVPWAAYKVAQEAAKGLCQKCFQETIIQRRGTQLTGLHNSAIFTDITMGINSDAFAIPDEPQCKKLKNFGHDLRFDPNTYGFIMRFHQDRTFEDDPEMNKPPPGPRRAPSH